MVIQTDELVRDVRVCIDRDANPEPLFEEGDGDALTLDGVIRSKLEEAAERVLRAAPAHMLGQGHSFADAEVYWDGLESGHVLLPDDFMRLVTFRMSDWERSVHTAIGPEDEGYALRSSRVKALRGTSQRPVCAITQSPAGLVLEFYSCKSESAEIEAAQYVPYPRVDRDGGLDISEKCRSSVVYMAAALTMAALGEADKAANLLSLTNTHKNNERNTDIQ